MMAKLRDIIDTIANPVENEKLNKIRDDLSRPLARVLTEVGFSPTFLNLTGLLAGIMSGVVIGCDNIHLGAVLFLLSIFGDMFDGPVARYQGVVNDFGVFFDAVCDRYVDIAILSGIAWYYFAHGQELLSLLALVSILGTSVVSYSKARAESLEVTVRSIGLMGRPVRLVALTIGLFLTQTLPIVLWILAIFTNLTAIQRIVFYASVLRSRKPF